MFRLVLFYLICETFSEDSSSTNSIPSSMTGQGMTMGGSGIGGVTWFFASDTSNDSEGCTIEAEHESLKTFLTKMGERPGAKSGLESVGIKEPKSDVNLCILRPPNWVFRPGKVDLIWIPDQSGFRKNGKVDQREDDHVDTKTKQREFLKTEL